MKNKIIKIFTSITCLIFILFGSILCGKAEQRSSASALSFYAVEETEETEKQESTPFLVDPVLMENSNEYIFVFDKADSCLKVVDKALNDFRSENYVFKTNFVPTNILVVNNYVLLYDHESGAIQCLNSQDFTEYEIDATLSTILDISFKFETIQIGGKDMLLVCPENPIENVFNLIEFDNVSDENHVQIKEKTQFKISNRFTNFSAYDHIFACQKDENLFLMLLNNDSILSFEYDLSTKPSEITLSKAVNGFNEMSNLADFGAVVFENGERLLAINVENKIEFYSLSIGSTSTELSHVLGKDILLEEGFNLVHLCTNKGTMALLSSDLQQINIYSFSGILENFNTTLKLKRNPDITTEYWSDYDKFIYVKAVQSVNLFDYPYSKNVTIQIPENSTATIIGQGKLSEDKYIVGYNFIMFSKNDKNYYGYVRSDALSELEKSSYGYKKVTVFSNTALLKMPSFVRDTINTEIKLLPITADVTVCETESGLYNFTSMGTQFLRVTVKDGNNTLEGFIDASRAKPIKSENVALITNGSIKKDNAEVFLYEKSDSEIITLLDKGARIKILSKRNTKTNMTEIAFKDGSGVVREGYVYNYNVQSDTWTMLQILGMTLVIINTVLLVVIICIKNKVTK